VALFERRDRLAAPGLRYLKGQIKKFSNQKVYSPFSTAPRLRREGRPIGRWERWCSADDPALSNEILEATRGWLSAGDGEGAKTADVAW